MRGFSTQDLFSRLPDLRHSREFECCLPPGSPSYEIQGAQETISRFLVSGGWRHPDVELPVLTETRSGAKGLSNLRRRDMKEKPGQEYSIP
jgi:hypothetical protein